MAAPRARGGGPTARRSGPRASPGTKVTRNRPPDRVSSAATCLASRSGLRPGRSMVVPSFSLGLWAPAQASPTRGSKVGALSTSGSHSESNPSSTRSSASADNPAGSTRPGPALTPTRTFTAGPSASRCRAQRHQGPPEAFVVDVAVRHQSDHAVVDGLGQDPLAGEVVEQLGRCGRAEHHDVGPHVGGVEPGVGPARGHGLGQPPRPGVVLGQRGPPSRGRRGPARPAPRPGACRRRGACARRRAAAITSAGPASSDPTGAHSPLDRQDITVVARRGQRGRPRTPVATSALKSRAPSRCTRHRPGRATTADSAPEGQGTPPAAMWVFSTQTRDRRAGGRRRPDRAWHGGRGDGAVVVVEDG